MALFDNYRFLIFVCVVTSLVSLYDAAPSVPVEQPISTCPKFMITCDDGQCIDRNKWCDEIEDCKDDSDETYCRTKVSFWNSNPNYCNDSTHLKCKNAICVPLATRCDGFKHCTDGSDEEDCKNESSEEDDSSEENGENNEVRRIEQEETDQHNRPVTLAPVSDDTTDYNPSQTPATPNQQEAKPQIQNPCPDMPTPCVQSQCQYDSTSCPYIHNLCSQLQMICSGRLSPWPCPNPCFQNNNPCPQVYAPCAQNGNPCPPVQSPCVQNNNPCPHVQVPCVPYSTSCPHVQTPGVSRITPGPVSGGSGSSAKPSNSSPCPHVPNPPSVTPCPHVPSPPNTPPCPNVPRPPNTPPCPHVPRPPNTPPCPIPCSSPSIPCPTSSTSCPHTSSTTRSTTQSTTTQRQLWPTRSRVPSTLNPIIQAITPPTRTSTRSTKSPPITKTPVQVPYTTTTKSPNSPTSPCPNVPSTKCPHQQTNLCPNGPRCDHSNCQNPCHNHNPNSCPNACNPCDPECNPCNPCDPECNPGTETPTEPTPTPPCVTPPGPCSHIKERSFEFPESEYEEFRFEYDERLENAKKWLLDTRNTNYDWGTETPRSLVALSLLDQNFFSDFKSVDNGLMKRAFQVKLALEDNANSRYFNERLAQYVNAMVATNQNPRDFHGKDLVADLQERVDNDWKDNKPINPFISLSLCLAGGHSEDARKYPYHVVAEWLNPPPTALHKHQDMMSFAIMTLACYANDPSVKTNYQKDIEGAVHRLLKRMHSNGSFGSKYSTALAAQALLSVKTRGVWDARKTLDFLANQQLEDGSFGNMMATYYIVPALLGKSLVHLLNTACEAIGPTETDAPIPETTTTPQPIILTKKILLSLYVGDEYELLSRIQLNMSNEANLLEVMQKASEINTDFRFRYDIINNRVLIYSISGIPNDAERHHYWKLYIQSDSEPKLITERAIYDKGGLEQIYPENGNLIFFHYKNN